MTAIWDWVRGYLTAVRHMAHAADWINPTTLQVSTASLSAFAAIMAWRVSARVARQGEWDRVFRAKTSARSAALALHQRAALAIEELRPHFDAATVAWKLRQTSLSERQILREHERLRQFTEEQIAAAMKFMVEINQSNNAYELEVVKSAIDLASADLNFKIVEVRRKIAMRLDDISKM